MRNLLSIGTLSNASHLSVKALRRYHELGLLVPAAVDARTGYRGYSVSQITEARIIRRLRRLDVPLEDIARILRSGDAGTTAQVLGEHRARMKLRLEETERIVSDLQRLVDEPGELHRVLVHERWQRAEPIVRIGTRTVWADLPEFFDAAYPRLFAHVARHGGQVVGPSGASYGSGQGIDHDDIAVSAWLAVDVALPADPAAGVVPDRLPETRLAVALHVGAFEDMSATYGAVGAWVAEHDRVVTGPLQELYLAGPPGVTDPDAWRTEVGWPVAPAEDPTPDERNRP
ncbi:MerR family transcriptional regulator [Pseudonocardia humida]|uniref:MerR family transcriptional regulator n=1 Tax=Pseudonocardia humida TaxID=2800819 RepID=A0ABT0ZU34_9PSEU|nr:MerR family transcriptional regulator [Pseudonocardia humida]MCO1654233.1 MerR family transcriptional regulator [Pseudonocardia humida]